MRPCSLHAILVFIDVLYPYSIGDADGELRAYLSPKRGLDDLPRHVWYFFVGPLVCVGECIQCNFDMRIPFMLVDFLTPSHKSSFFLVLTYIIY